MPLIVMCGFPSSGKTSRSTQIMQYFVDRFNNENKPNSVHIINDESLGISKDSYKGMSFLEFFKIHYNFIIFFFFFRYTP
jgi:tRNA uridine 5-carbamoylmethylation protein Kti12